MPVSSTSAPMPGDGSELGSLLQAALEKEDPGHTEQVRYPLELSRENFLAMEVKGIERGHYQEHKSHWEVALANFTATFAEFSS